MIAILLLGIVPVEIIPTAEVDQVWRNEAVNSDSGDTLIKQHIYWRWYGEGHRADGFDVTPDHMEYDHYRKRWFRFRLKNGVLSKIVTKAYIDGPTIGDPELADRELLDVEDRVGLFFWPRLP